MLDSEADDGRVATSRFETEVQLRLDAANLKKLPPEAQSAAGRADAGAAPPWT